MKLTLRPYHNGGDYWRVRAFLREVFLLNHRCELSWPVARWDYWRWHGVENVDHFNLSESVFLWETSDGRVAAVLNPEGRGDAHLQVHPALVTPALEEEMLTSAEECLSIAADGGRRRLCVWSSQSNAQRGECLARRGYNLNGWAETQRVQALDHPIPNSSPAPGYCVRALGDESELPTRSWASFKAFHPHDPDEGYGGWEWYRNIQRAPLYRRDLDMVAVTDDGLAAADGGVVAAFCTIWYDDVTRSAYIEPVGCMPAHQRRGLGRAVIAEGLRRLQRLGANLAFVGSYESPAHELYAALGFAPYDQLQAWVREW